MKRLLPVIVLATGLMMAGCSSAPAPAETPAASPAEVNTPTPTPTPEPPTADGTREAPYAYGTVAHVTDDSLWDFTIHTPQADANTWVSEGSVHNEVPADGNTWVGANIAVTVRDVPSLSQAAAEPVNIAFNVSPVFVGSSGTIYDFWTVNYPAQFGDTPSWNAQPDVFVSAGQSWDSPFALQVPTSEVEGGYFAVKHGQSGKVVFFK